MHRSQIFQNMCDYHFRRTDAVDGRDALLREKEAEVMIILLFDGCNREGIPGCTRLYQGTSGCMRVYEGVPG